MANYDHPAYTWVVVSKDMTGVVLQRDELDFPAITPSQLPVFVQAFEASGGGGGSAETSYPIMG